jgi:hypothetical protein
MKIVWALLAILLGCLSLGGLMAFGRRGDWFDLLIGLGLAWAAWGIWKGGVLAGRTRPESTGEPERPWRR